MTSTQLWVFAHNTSKAFIQSQSNRIFGIPFQAHYVAEMLMPFLKYSLLWETLTGREHLLFYGRLKNLKGAELLKVQFVIFVCVHQCILLFISS